MEKPIRTKIEELLLAPDQILLWRYVNAKTREYLETGYNGKLTIDFRNNRINSIIEQNYIVGISQAYFYNQKFPVDN